MSVVTEKLAAAGYITPEQAQGARDRAKALFDAMSQDSEKQAGVGDTVRQVGKGVQQAVPNVLGHYLVAGGLALAGSGGAYAAAKVRDTINKSRGYKEMMEVNPDLAENDAEANQRVYSTLFRFNPEYAKDPLVSGAFVREMSGKARMDLNSIGALVSARKNLMPTMSPFEQRLKDGLMASKGMGLSFGEEAPMRPSEQLKDLQAQEEMDKMRAGTQGQP